MSIFTQAGGRGRESAHWCEGQLTEDAEASRSRAGDAGAKTFVLLCPAGSHKLLPSAIPVTSLGWSFLCQEGRGLSRRGAMLGAFREMRYLFIHEKDLFIHEKHIRQLGEDAWL